MTDEVYPKPIYVSLEDTIRAKEVILDYAARLGQRAAYELILRVSVDRPTVVDDSYFKGSGFSYSHTRYSDVGDCLARMYEYTGEDVGKEKDR